MLMTIEIEEQNGRVTIISIKGAQEIALPPGYARTEAPAFSKIHVDSRIALVSAVIGPGRSPLGRGENIFYEGETYLTKDFERRLAFIKAAGKRLTEINRDARKPKRRTITI